MKKINLLLLGLVVCAGFFTSCSDDDKNNGVNEPSSETAVIAATEYDEWTYFNFETGTSKSLSVKGVEGAVTGVYYGDFVMSVMGKPTQQDSVKIVISPVATDTVLIQFYDLRVGMGGKEPEPFNFSGKAFAKKTADKWILTGVEGTNDIKDGDKMTVWTVKFDAEIGITKGADFSITGNVKPGAMPFALTVSCMGKVDNSKTYAVDGDETSFDWDIAFHKYDIRTNGGSAIKTDKKVLSAVVELPVTGLVMDVDGSVMVDMSQMMEDFVGYQYCPLNKTLCSWVTKTLTGTMPPATYAVNPEVFIVKTKAGKYAKIKFTDHTNEKDQAVYAAFEIGRAHV